MLTFYSHKIRLKEDHGYEYTLSAVKPYRTMTFNFALYFYLMKYFHTYIYIHICFIFCYIFGFILFQQTFNQIYASEVMVAERPSSSSSLEMERSFLGESPNLPSKGCRRVAQVKQGRGIHGMPDKGDKMCKTRKIPVGTGKKISLVLLDVGRVGMPNNEAGDLYKSQVIQDIPCPINVFDLYFWRTDELL